MATKWSKKEDESRVVESKDQRVATVDKVGQNWRFEVWLYDRKRALHVHLGDPAYDSAASAARGYRRWLAALRRAVK